MNKKEKIEALKAMKELLVSNEYQFICNTYPSNKSIEQDLPELYKEIYKEIIRTNNLQDTPDLDISKFTIHYPTKSETKDRIDLIDRVINKIKNNNKSPIKYKVNNIEFTIDNGIAKSKYSDLSIADIKLIHKWVVNFNYNYNPYGSSTVYLSGSNLYFNSTFINELTQLLNLTIKSKDI